MDQEANDQEIRMTKKTGKNSFERFGFCYELYKAIVYKGFRNAMPIQKKAIPIVMEGRDAIVSSRTGSGKTLAYVLPLINRLKCHSQIVGARALILIPTRDLAMQVASVLKDFTKFTDLRYALVLGGHSYEGQFEVLASNPDIIVATPGRLMQLLVETDLKLSRVEMLIFDEADNLFEKGFEMQMSQILKRCPVSQKLMFSATIPEQLNQFANSGLRDYVYINHDVSLPERMSLDFYIVRAQDKLPMLLYLLSQIPNQKVIVFASTRYHVDILSAFISKQMECLGVYGKMDMEQRNETITNFRNSKKAVLVVTDLAARGLDVPEVGYVIHYDYPSNHKIFVHRSGRTARKGQDGHAISLISHTQMSYMVEVCHYVSRKLMNEFDSEAKEVAYYGTVPYGLLSEYAHFIGKELKRDGQLKKMNETAEKAMQKFIRCRTPASSFSVKLTKELQMNVHHNFENRNTQQQKFIEKIRNFTPQKSFLELQRIRQDNNEDNDPFLQAVSKIRKEQEILKKKKVKKTQISQMKEELVKERLNEEELEDLRQYKEKADRKAVRQVPGVEIQIVGNKVKKSQVRDFRDQSQYIENVRMPGQKSQFDELQKIGNMELDDNLNDEGKVRTKKKRVWDKQAKTFKYSKDQEDKMSKDKKGQEAYKKWKKKTHLSLQKVGDMEDEEKTNLAKDYWQKRRKFAKGWKQNRAGKDQTVNRRRTEVIRKKIKKRLIGAGRPTKKIKNNRRKKH